MEVVGTELGEGEITPDDTITVETTEEETITDAEIGELVERIDALTVRVTQLEGLLAELVERIGGHDTRFSDIDARFRKEEPSQRHWYFRRLTPQID